MKKSKSLTEEQKSSILSILKKRFIQNEQRHLGMNWLEVESRLLSNETALWSLFQMEETGGEPDVVGKEGEHFIFFDCAKESPTGRRSFCYDQEALEARKQDKPKDSAMQFVENIGVQLLNEEQYRFLQTLGEFDLKTSSWLLTPQNIRDLGGALFGDRRYNTVFTYHNGAISYYAARGFRACITI